MSLEAEIPGTWVGSEQYQMIMTRYLFSLDYVRNKDVLEVGCGCGLGFGILRHHAKSIKAIDQSEWNVQKALEHYDTSDIVQMDAHTLFYQKNRFDTVVCMEVLQYLDAIQFLKQVRRVLKPKGMFVGCVPNPDSSHWTLSKLSQQYFTVPLLSVLFKSAGFTPTIYGAFPTNNAQPWGRSRKDKFLTTAGRVINVAPPLKRMVAKRLFKKRPLPPEICFDNNTGLLEPLTNREPSTRHKILYVVAVNGEDS